MDVNGWIIRLTLQIWTHYRLHSVHKNDHSVHKNNHSVHKNELSQIDIEVLEQIAQPARTTKRLPPSEMEQLILKLCEGRWLTRNELGNLLHRNPDGLRSRFLTSMLEHGLIRLRYPDKPNRTDQAYTTASDEKRENKSLP